MHKEIPVEMQESNQTVEKSKIGVETQNKYLKNLNGLFLLSVALPTLIAVVYFGFITSDVYISESRFVVRSPKQQTPTGLGAILQGAGFSRSEDDTHSVLDFILSRDALE